MIRVLNVQQDKVEGGGIRQFLSRKGDQNSLVEGKFENGGLITYKLNSFTIPASTLPT